MNKLDLSANSLITIPEGAFTGQTKLKELLLFDNKLQTLPEKVFQGLSSLNALYLQRNKLRSLPSGVFQDLPLESIILDSNEIKYLPGDVFRGLSLEKLNRIALYRNPWDCGITICNSWLTQEIISKFPSKPSTECASISLLNDATKLSEMPRICHLSCPSITDPANGTVSTGNITYGTTRTFQCHAGFKITGSTSTTCQESQTWSSPPPSCTSTASGKFSGWSNSKDLPVVDIGLLILTVVFSNYY